nr:MAG TPA: hypothetical protein [Caudoviricetes sp.]
MTKDVIDKLVDYIENCTYIDVLQILTDEEHILQKYDSTWSDKVDKVIRNSIANNHDALYASVLNECYIAFGLSKKERDEIVSRLKKGE